MGKYFNLILIALLTFLFTAFNKFEYGEVQVLKIALVVGFGYQIFDTVAKKSYFLSTIYTFLAITFLPFLDLKIDRDLWELLDIIAIGVLSIHFLILLFGKKEQESKKIKTEEDLIKRKKMNKKVAKYSFVTLGTLIFIVISIFGYWYYIENRTISTRHFEIREAELYGDWDNGKASSIEFRISNNSEYNARQIDIKVDIQDTTGSQIDGFQFTIHRPIPAFSTRHIEESNYNTIVNNLPSKFDWNVKVIKVLRKKSF